MVRSSLVTGTMPAAVYQGHHTVTVERLPIPEPDDGEVLLEVSHCGICGSDLHLMMEDWGQPGSTGGHEYSGVIVAVGQSVDGWRVGDRVVGGPDQGCGHCASCAGGRPNLCLGKDRLGIDGFQGAFAAYKKLAATSLFRVPPGLRPPDGRAHRADGRRAPRRASVGPAARPASPGHRCRPDRRC